MQNILKLRCYKCKKKFLRSRAEVRRTRRMGYRKVYCSQSCQVSTGNHISPRGTTEYLDPANRKDKLTPFRWFLARARQRKNKGETNLTLKYLKKIWKGQRGRCPFTNWKLHLPDSTSGWEKGICPRNASLDRIDNSLGYVRGNVRFVAIIANYSRCRFSDRQMLKFCKAVVRSN